MKKILFSVMMLAALASCTKNNNSADISGSVPEIKLSGKALSVETKGAFTGTAPTVATPLKALVIGSLVDGNYTNQYVSGVMTFTDKAVGFNAGFAGTNKYPAAAAPVYMIGLHPETGWVDAGTGSQSLVMNGTQDVMIARQISTSSADVAVGGTIKNFNFKHKLTQIEVKVVVDGAKDVADAWGVLKTMNLPGQFNNTATVTMLGESTIDFSNPVTNWSLYAAADVQFVNQSVALPISRKAAGVATDVELITAAKVAGYTMFAPITTTAGIKAFDIAITSGVDGDTTNDIMTTVPVILKATGNADFVGSTEGYKFSILLVFKAKTIHATATVEAWTEGGTSLLPIE